MTRWRWDADPGSPLIKHRIPETAASPLHSYVAALYKDSPHWPTGKEIAQLRSFIDEHAAHWLTERDKEQNARQPFDTEPGRNTVVFRKYGTRDWGYRRKSWPSAQFVPPPPLFASRAPGPLSLVGVMDLVHSGFADRVADWEEWKAEHPEVFG